jgi:hypothetical protein
MSPRTTNLQRSQQINYGGKVTIAGSEGTRGIAWVTVDESDSYTLYARAKHVSGPLASPSLLVEWGHGGATIDRVFPLTLPLTLPVAASMIRLSARVVDAEGRPLRDAMYEFEAFIARGHADVPAVSTAVAQVGAMGLFGSGPQRLVRLIGYRASPWFLPRWVMLFDAARVTDVRTGLEPVTARPLPLYPRCVELASHDFARGIVWAISEDPLRLVVDQTAAVRMEAELAA